MASTKSSRTRTLTPFSLETYHPGRHRLRLILESPSRRPAVTEEVQADVERFIANSARTYTDDSCPELKFDELVAKGWAKFAYMLHYGYMISTRTRVCFFKCFAAAVKNLYRSEVQKYRYTEKRTGVKPPPRDEIFTGKARPKTVEVCADDPEMHLQIRDHPDHSRDREMRELTDDFKQYLNPQEVMVCAQLLEPNEIALSYAWVEAHRGRESTALLRVRLDEKALHYGLVHGDGDPAGKLTLDQFHKTVLSIQRKYDVFRRMTSDDQEQSIRRNAMLAQLGRVFNLQIPPVEDIVVRRMLTIAARKQPDKAEDPAVAEMLEEVGAYVPAYIGKTKVLSCYGVLYNRYEQKCISCELRMSCRVKADNLGLLQMTISPELLGAQNVRTPHVGSSHRGPLDKSVRDMEIVVYLDENFDRLEQDGKLSWAHSRQNGRSQKLFQVETDDRGVLVKFIGPSLALRQLLMKRGNSWYAPSTLCASEAISLIDQHGRETVINAHA